MVFGFPYSPSNVSKYTIVTILFSLCPFALLAKVTLGKETVSPRGSWKRPYLTGTQATMLVARCATEAVDARVVS